MILSAGVVIVRKEAGTWTYLFLRAYRNWDFPKGIVEAGEDPLEAAVREAEEETGITDLNFRWGRAYKETAPYHSGGKKVARYYIAQTPQSRVTLSINPELGRPEHHEYLWLPYDEIRKRAPKRLELVIEWAHGVLQGATHEA
jgi:8-oxo-dGTP pyrophosphatase MutT (NUDIX family)